MSKVISQKLFETVDIIAGTLLFILHHQTTNYKLLYIRFQKIPILPLKFYQKLYILFSEREHYGS